MSKNNIPLGRQGEDEAVRLLKRKGYRILERNYRTRSAEIDIIARDKKVFCFIEVKTRLSGSFGEAGEAVDERKQAKIFRAAEIFLKEKGLADAPARFDVVSVIPSQGGWRTELIKNAFEGVEI